MDTCKNPRKPHTVMYWVEDGGPPIPMISNFDNRKDAVKFSESGISQNNPILRWIKIYRSDNEAYTCWRWENPEPYERPEPTPYYVAPEKKRRWWRR